MKNIGILVLAFLLLAVSCKTSKKAVKEQESPYQTTLNAGAPAKVFSVPDTNKDKPAAVEEKPITVRKESVTFTKAEDKTGNESNAFFVIIGSFSSLDNAKNYRQELTAEGFVPIVLHSETAGYYRVCVDSFNDEKAARERIFQIRKDYPKYFDTWLLKKE